MAKATRSEDSARLQLMLDLDGVVINFYEPFIEWVNKTYGESLTMEDWDNYDRFGGFRADEIKQLITEFAGAGNLRRLPLMKNAKKGVQRLSRIRDIVYCTSRDLFGAYDTIKWLSRNGVDRPVFFNPDKIGFCNSQNIGELVEDNPEVLGSAWKNKNIMMYGIMATYNKHLWHDYDVVMLSDLAEVADYLLSLEV